MNHMRFMLTKMEKHDKIYAPNNYKNLMIATNLIIALLHLWNSVFINLDKNAML